MRFCLFLSVLLVLAGCGKNGSGSSTSSNNTERQARAPGSEVTPGITTPAVQPNPASPADMPPEALAGAVHAFMTEQLHIFIQQSGRLPKDFREFAAARMDSVPRLPPGMKYVVDTNTVEVKIVRQ